MKNQLRLALAQIDPTVGDLQANCDKIRHYLKEAEDSGADILAFPELALTGYPPEDLLLKKKFVDDNLKLIREISQEISNIVVIIGFVDRQKHNLYNAAAIIYRRMVRARYHKVLLPNYGVFDEKRYFSAGREFPVFKIGGIIFAVNICEDIWQMDGPAKHQSALGAKLLINISASPYNLGKLDKREAVIQRQAKARRASIAYVNIAGAQDELVFDGASMIVDKNGRLACRAGRFKEELLVHDLELDEVSANKQRKAILLAEKLPSRRKESLAQVQNPALEPLEEVYQALSLGLGDYARKNNFSKAVIGLSGGIDSALVASLAADALGRDNVVGVFMPSRYTSDASGEDARKLAQGLGIKYLSISIEEIRNLYLRLLEPHFSGVAANIAEENLQARIRGNILMALSNKFGWLVLATGNKSEMSTGYATLYGDMAGGLAVIKDVPKTLVYKLAKYRNSLGAPVIPERVLTKEPTAELKENQKDTDTLPDYDTLDSILEAYIEGDLDLAGIAGKGFNKEVVSKVLNMVDRSEYKRRQSPPGIKITHKAFGKDRRMPITNKYRG